MANGHLMDKQTMQGYYSSCWGLRQVFLHGCFSYTILDNRSGYYSAKYSIFFCFYYVLLVLIITTIVWSYCFCTADALFFYHIFFVCVFWGSILPSLTGFYFNKLYFTNFTPVILIHFETPPPFGWDFHFLLLHCDCVSNEEFFGGICKMSHFEHQPFLVSPLLVCWYLLFPTLNASSPCRTKSMTLGLRSKSRVIFLVLWFLFLNCNCGPCSGPTSDSPVSRVASKAW